MSKPISEDNLTHQAGEWWNDHEEPSDDDLNRMAADNSARTYERLREIAEMHNVHVDANTTRSELVARIRLAMTQDDDLSHNQ